MLLNPWGNMEKVPNANSPGGMAPQHPMQMGMPVLSTLQPKQSRPSYNPLKIPSGKIFAKTEKTK